MTSRSSKTGGQHPGRHAGGRPRKFSEPSRPITLTLPATTLRQLQQIDSDRGRAIVKLAQNATWESSGREVRVEVVEISPDTGLVVIGPAPSLKKIHFLQLVEVAPARFLLALAPGHDFLQLEIALSDLVEDLPESGAERQLISKLLEYIRGFRKTESVSMAQILLLRLKST